MLLTGGRPGEASCPLGFGCRRDRRPTPASLFGSHSFGRALPGRPRSSADTSCRGFPLGSSHIWVSPVWGSQPVRRRLLGSGGLPASSSHLAGGAGSRRAVSGGRRQLQLPGIPAVSRPARRLCSRSSPCRCGRSGDAFPDSQRFLQGGVQQLQLLQFPGRRSALCARRRRPSRPQPGSPVIPPHANSLPPLFRQEPPAGPYDAGSGQERSPRHRRVPPPLSAAHLRAAPCGAHAERPGVTAPPGRHRGAPRARTHPRSTFRPRSALRSNSLRRSAPPRSAACSAAANLRGPSRERQPSPPRSSPPRAPLPGRSPPAAARRQHSASRRPPALLPALPGTAAAAGGSGGGTDCGPPRCAARRDSSGGRGKKRE